MSVASYKRTTIRKSPYGYWVVTHGTARVSMTFPTGDIAIRAVASAIQRENARRAALGLPNTVRDTRNVRLRDRIARRDGPHCHYCKKPLPHAKRTIDHVVPKSLGGPSSLDNYVLACGGCNRKKGSTVRPTHCTFCATACDMYWDATIAETG